MTLVQSEPKSIKIWTTEIKRIMMRPNGTEKQIRPVWPTPRPTITSFNYANKTLSTPQSTYWDENTITFSKDGTKLYFAWENKNVVYQWTLSTPRDITTATYDNKNKATWVNVTTSIMFSEDGTIMWIGWGWYTAYIYKYTLSTAWDVSTATYVWDTTWKSNVSFYGCTWMCMSIDGQYMFVLSRENNWIRRYTMVTPYDITTLQGWAWEYQQVSISAYSHTVQLNPQWTQLFYYARTDKKIHICSLSTPFDLTTFTEVSQYTVSTPNTIDITEIHIDNWWNSMYLWWWQLNNIYQYNTVTS